MRKNAVLAINALYKLPKGEHLLQDAPELIEKVSLAKNCFASAISTFLSQYYYYSAHSLILQVLLSEQDLSTRRNAFQMLCNHAQSKAVSYLLSQVDNVAHWGDILQMAVLELIRKVRPDCQLGMLDRLLLYHSED